LIWLDALMGFVGAAVITKWAYNLIQDTSSILLDGTVDKQTRLAVLTAIEEDADNRVADLHLWYLGQDSVAVMVSLVTHYPRSPEHYKNLLKHIPSLAHVSRNCQLVEFNFTCFYHYY
jgi:Co/Zn/Cd efflux system component